MKASSFASSTKTDCSCSPSPLTKRGRRVVLTISL
nr:MAG TPA: hypothetical protein [Caudoviricetes sp.]